MISRQGHHDPAFLFLDCPWCVIIAGMKPRVLLINPPIYDFSAYDFWLRPLGLLTVAGYLRPFAEMVLFDYLDRSDPAASGGKPSSETFGRGRLAARIIDSRHHARVARLLKEGKLAFGGEVDAANCYIAPTVLRDVSPDSDVMREEIFGPVLPVLPVDTIDEAVDFVNRRDKPLALYLFTRRHSVQEEVLSRTSSGGACVNGTMLHAASHQLASGCVGSSCMGAYHGHHSFETFSHRKSVLTKGWRFDAKLMYPPYGGFATKMFKRLPLEPTE